jgi:hypothetical protein
MGRKSSDLINGFMQMAKAKPTEHSFARARFGRTQLIETLSSKGLLSYYTKIHFSILDMFFSNVDIDITPNSDVKPSKAHTYSVHLS